MGLFDNFNGSPLTASNPQFSAVQKPDFSISLDIGKSSGFGQGLFPQLTFGETKPQTQAERAKQQVSNRLDQQAQDFHSNLQNIINPQKKDFDPTKQGMTDYGQQFSDMAQPFLQQNKLRTGLMLQQSNDPGTQLLGKVQADEAIADATKTPGWVSGNSTVNERSFSDKFSNSTFGKSFGVWSAGLDTANSMLTGILGEKSEYSGPKGELTKTLDTVYDNIADGLANVPVWGQAASLIMKGGKMLGTPINKMGGGTDGMTNTDAILGSAFFNLTPIGLINGFGGKKADTITKDDQVFETVGSSYTGTESTVDDALTKSGKKYGLFSSGSREKANREIAEAKRQQQVMTEIADQATDRFAIRNSMAAINGNRRAFAMIGGYDQSAVRAGRHGLSINTILTAKRVVSALKFKAKPIQEPVEEPQPVVDSFQQGGILELTLQDIPEEYLEPMSTIEEVTLDSILPEFKEGGKVNVIPEGALHARLHHMENAENLTKKGIPVVAEKEGGELEQQAEIERNEVILRLEVTKRLEELQRNYDNSNTQEQMDSFAIEAGKLLVYELLHNTVDNTGLLDEI